MSKSQTRTNCDQTLLIEELNAQMRDATGVCPDWTSDIYGNNFGWLRLPGPDKLLAAVKILVEHKARLATITAYSEERADPEKRRVMAYHFAIGGPLFTVTFPIYDPETLDKLSVPSITPYFRNADWNEREFMEMFNIEVVDHPNPKRLFLDERLDAGIMTSLIPFSAMMHGSGNQALWEKILAEKAGLEPRRPKQEELQEPAFTPVKEPGAVPNACADAEPESANKTSQPKLEG